MQGRACSEEWVVDVHCVYDMVFIGPAPADKSAVECCSGSYQTVFLSRGAEGETGETREKSVFFGQKVLKSEGRDTFEEDRRTSGTERQQGAQWRHRNTFRIRVQSIQNTG